MMLAARHEVADILSCPGDWTGGFARYHEQRTARHSHTYSTWCIVTIFSIYTQWLTICYVILQAMDIVFSFNT